MSNAMDLTSLASISTRDLVEELRKRQGVEAITVEPYDKIAVETEGPAIVLIVID